MQLITLYALVAVNLVTFGAFGIDKWMARKGRRCIPEARLLLLAWATGMFGAWVGMSVFRHTTGILRMSAVRYTSTQRGKSPSMPHRSANCRKSGCLDTLLLHYRSGKNHTIHFRRMLL